MADVTISQLSPGTPAGNNVIPYSTGTVTLGVPVSAMLHNAGNIGIGISNPARKLEVNGAIKSYSAGGNLIFNADSGYEWWTGSWNDLVSYQVTRRRISDGVGVAHLTIDAAGNVGIGPITPATKLDVNGTIKATGLQVPGCIVQVVQAVKSDTSGPLLSNGVETIVPGIAASITPKFSTSKILINAQICYAATAGSTTWGGYFKRNNVIIAIGNEGTGQQRVSIPMSFSADNNQSMSVPYMYLDSPNSASVLTYQFYMINDNTNPAYINRSVLDSNSYAGTGAPPATGKRSISTVTLMEIAQ